MTLSLDFQLHPLYFVSGVTNGILNLKVVMALKAKTENNFDNLNLQMTNYFLIPMLKTK